MYFRFYLSTNKSNNTLEKFVEALVLSTQLDKYELKNFLLSCLDRIYERQYFELSLQILKEYHQQLTIDVNEIIRQRAEFVIFVEQNPQFEDAKRSMQTRCDELANQATRHHDVLYILAGLIATFEEKLTAKQWQTLVKSKNDYFDLTEAEFYKFESYKSMSSTFNDFFSAFVKLARPTKERLDSLLKYGEQPEDCYVRKIIFVDDHDASMLTQFQNLSLRAQESSSSYNSTQEIKSRTRPS